MQANQNMNKNEQTKLLLVVFVVLQYTLGCLRAWQLPVHFLASDLAQSSLHVMSATTMLSGTIVALDGSDP